METLKAHMSHTSIYASSRIWEVVRFFWWVWTQLSRFWSNRSIFLLSLSLRGCSALHVLQVLQATLSCVWQNTHFLVVDPLLGIPVRERQRERERQKDNEKYFFHSKKKKKKVMSERTRFQKALLTCAVVVVVVYKVGWIGIMVEGKNRSFYGEKGGKYGYCNKSINSKRLVMLSSLVMLKVTTVTAAPQNKNSTVQHWPVSTLVFIILLQLQI